VALGCVLAALGPRPACADTPALGALHVGGRFGFGGAYYLRTDDRRANALAVQALVAARVGLRAKPALSFYVEGAMLAQGLVLASTAAYVPPPPPGVPLAPDFLGLVSGTVGLRPIRFLELTLGPTLGGGPTWLGGGTARVSARIPAKGATIVPGLETFFVVGDRTGFGALFGTFGFEL